MKPHRLWIALLLATIALIFLTTPMTSRLMVRTEKEIQTLGQEKEARRVKIQQWKDDALKAEELSRTIQTYEIEKYLAPTDRNKLAEKLGPLASVALLTNFTFSLDPAVKWENDKNFPDIQGITQSHLSFEANAPHDVSLFSFLEALSHMSGRMDVQEIEIKRTNQDEISANNLHAKVSLLWLSNCEKGKNP